jgi:hypothetical protein
LGGGGGGEIIPFSKPPLKLQFLKKFFKAKIGFLKDIFETDCLIHFVIQFSKKPDI